jgi:hypothetical protein
VAKVVFTERLDLLNLDLSFYFANAIQSNFGKNANDQFANPGSLPIRARLMASSSVTSRWVPAGGRARIVFRGTSRT